RMRMRPPPEAQARRRAAPSHPVCGDPTTVSASVTPDGLCQCGHRKDDRPDRPPLQLALSPLAPLGLPLPSTPVAGNTADAPRALPESAKVRQSIGPTGMPSSGDGPMAAWATRAALVAHRDFSLCPRSAQQVSGAELERRLEPRWTGPQPREAVRLTDESAAADEEAPAAVGFAYPRAPDGQEQAGHSWHGQAQRWGVRALAHARRQAEPWRQRARRAPEEIKALNARQPGQKRLTDAAETRQAAEAIVAKHHGAEVVRLAVHTTVPEATQRRYGQRPAQPIWTTRVRVEANRALGRMAQVGRRRGWRVYATQPDGETRGLQQVVAASRSADLVEPGLRRFKGRAWSLPPLSWRDEHRIVGVIVLLRIALRVLILRQFVV